MRNPECLFATVRSKGALLSTLSAARSSLLAGAAERIGEADDDSGRNALDAAARDLAGIIADEVECLAAAILELEDSGAMAFLHLRSGEIAGCDAVLDVLGGV